MRVVRWILAFVAALIGFTIGTVGLFLLTRAVVPSAGVQHFWDMFTASLLAIYAGSVTVPPRDRVVGVLVFATIAVGYPAFFLLVGLIGRHAFGENASVGPLPAALRCCDAGVQAALTANRRLALLIGACA